MPQPAPARIELAVSPAAEPLLPEGLQLESLRARAEKALPHCRAVARPGSPLPDLPEIEVSLVSDAEIAAVHGQFLDDPTPTDVITFEHGEILISVETAARQAREYGHNQPVPREIALYLIHGLLHLAGWDDHHPDEAAAMAAEQERVLHLVWPPR